VPDPQVSDRYSAELAEEIWFEQLNDSSRMPAGRLIKILIGKRIVEGSNTLNGGLCSVGGGLGLLFDSGGLFLLIWYG